MAEEDDPFGVFSDDDDDSQGAPHKDSQKNEENESRRIANLLLAKANANPDPTSHQQFPTSNSDKEESRSVDLSYLKPLKLDWPSPLYLGSVILVEALPVGGGRGYVASRRIPAGTLILVEELAMEWPPEQLGKQLDLVSVSHVLRQPNAAKLVHDMEEFHPTKINVDKYADEGEHSEQISKMMNTLRNSHEESQIQELVELSKEKCITSRDGTPLGPNDIIRLLLALRYNGLESGVYHHVAMLNHDCHPNCAKFRPESNVTYSEVRTTQTVEAGENLTISYLPRIMSHASRRKYLWEQHRFDIGADLKGIHLKLELVENGLPKSNIQQWDDDSPTKRIEKATVELEQMLSDIQDQATSGGSESDTWELLKALEQTSLEMYNESTERLKNNSHILLIPILLTHVEACDLLLRKAPGLSTRVQLGIRSRQVQTIHRLLPLQMAYLGADHFDLARSNLDLANGIGELLSRSPKNLFDLNLPSLESFAQWSALEQRSRLEYNRLKNLYPTNTEEMIAGR